MPWCWNNAQLRGTANEEKLQTFIDRTFKRLFSAFFPQSGASHVCFYVIYSLRPNQKNDCKLLLPCVALPQPLVPKARRRSPWAAVRLLGRAPAATAT